MVPIPGIFTNNIPGIGIGTIPILELIPIPISIVDKDSYRYQYRYCSDIHTDTDTNINTTGGCLEGVSGVSERYPGCLKCVWRVYMRKGRDGEWKTS